MSTYTDSDGRERHSRCGWLIDECQCTMIPPGGFPAEATAEQVMNVACPLCSAPAGELCDGSHYNWFTLPVVIRGMPRVHTRRYQAAVGANSGGSRP